jgi:hypothetical protein
MKADGMNPITEDDIASTWPTPDFFARQANCWRRAALPHGSRAVSLEHRAECCARSNPGHRLMDMVRHGNGT